MKRDSKKSIKQWRQLASGIYFPEEIDYLEHNIWEEKVQMAGFLSIYSYPGTDRSQAIALDLGHNLIVDLGREAMARLQRDTVDGGIYHGLMDLGYLALGNGSNNGASVPNNATSALFSETTGDPAMAPPCARKVLSVTTPPPGPPYITNLWSAQIGPTEFNDTTNSAFGRPFNEINEAGMYCLDTTTLYNMRTFANQYKSSGITFEFRWSVIW
jgi:hypothetical protein